MTHIKVLTEFVNKNARRKVQHHRIKFPSKLLSFPMTYFILGMNNRHDGATSHRIEYNLKHVDKWFSYEIEICFLKFCRAFDAASFFQKTTQDFIFFKFYKNLKAFL
jgi:hypothetical protein